LPREKNEAVHPGQFPEALRVYMEMVKSKKGDVNDMTLALFQDIRMATLNQSITRATGSAMLAAERSGGRII
jgi:hypothetical protein